MVSWLKSITDFFARIFSFGRKILSAPFFDHVFAIAGLLYPPAAPIIDAVDKLFEQETQEGFLEQLEALLERSGLDSKSTDILKHLICMLMLTDDDSSPLVQDEQKAALTREILKTAIAANTSDFKTFRVSDTLRRVLGLDLSGIEDKDNVPDHLVNFAIEFSIVQRKFNDLLDRMVTLAKPVVEKIGKSTQQSLEKMLEEGRTRNLWTYSSVDYERDEVRKAVAALLVKEQAVEQGLLICGHKVEALDHIPDSLANLAVEACYANFKQGKSTT